MARKDPYKVVKVHEKIYATLDKRRESDSEGMFKVPSMNAFVEAILWDYAVGKIVRAGTTRPETAGMDVVRSVDVSGLGKAEGERAPGPPPGSRRKSSGESPR